MNMLSVIPEPVLRIAQAVLRAGYPCYAVGGAVRGAVLGLPAADYDICGPATVEQIERAVREDPAIGCSRKYGRMGTMRLSIGDSYAEYTTFRSERYEGGHTPAHVSFVQSAAEDALRRDFTCNALYLDLASGGVVDPTGGLADIGRGMLRATTPDPSVIMRDDGVRVLRMVRFAAQLRFAVEDRTFACADAGLLRDIARERTQGELTQILLSDTRYDLPGGKEFLRAALEQMEELGIWQEIAPGCAVERGACADAPPVLALRLAALLQSAGQKRAVQWLEDMRYPASLCKEAGNLVADLCGEDAGACFLLRRGYGHAEALVALRPAWEPLLAKLRRENAPGSIAELALGGEDATRILGESSPRVGAALRMLWRHTVEHPGDNTAERLTDIVREWMEGEKE